MGKIIDWFYDRFLTTFLKISGVIMTITVILQIAARYLPIRVIWTEELARLLFLWFSYIGAVITLRNKMHLAIDYFFNKYHPSFQRFCDYINYLLIMGTSLFLLVYGIKLTSLVSIQTSPVFGVSMSWFYVPVPIAGGLFFIEMVVSLIAYIRGNDKKPVNSTVNL